MDENKGKPNNSEPHAVGDYGGGISAKRIEMTEKRLERRALKEGWISVVDEHAESMVKRIVVDVLGVDSAPKDRRLGFAALMKAKNEAEGKGGLRVNIQNNLTQMQLSPDERKAWAQSVLEQSDQHAD